MINWDQCRKDYESTEMTQGELADKYGVTQQAVSQRIKREQWTRPDKELVARCSDLSLITDVDARNLGKRTPGNIAKFVEVFSITGSQKTAANSIGLSENQATTWMKSDPELVQLCAAKRNTFLSEQVAKIAGARDWQAARYLLAHAKETRDQFGDDRTDAGPVVILNIQRS